MSTKSRKENKDKEDPFAFLPIIFDLLKKFTLAETTEKDIANVANSFNEQMTKANKALHQTPGLELTEEEQLQKIKELEEMIEQKEQLIEQCTKSLQQWTEEK